MRDKGEAVFVEMYNSSSFREEWIGMEGEYQSSKGVSFLDEACFSEI